MQQSPALTPAAGVGAADVRGADTETGRKRARHSRSGGAVPRTLGFEDARSSAAGQAMLPPADLPSVPGLDNDATAEGAHGKPLGLTEVETTGNEGERKAASSASSESEEESASGGGAAAAAAKALARVMRLHSEQAQLQRAIQVCPWPTLSAQHTALLLSDQIAGFFLPQYPQIWPVYSNPSSHKHPCALLILCQVSITSGKIAACIED